MSASKKVLLWNELNIVWIERDPERDLPGKPFETAGQEKIIFYVFIVI